MSIVNAIVEATMKRLWVWIVSLVALSFIGFGIAIVFQQSNSPILVLIVYAATGAFLCAMALVIFAISLWKPFSRSRRKGR